MPTRSQGGIVLFGAGSPIIVDFEETCARCHLEIAAIITNVEGPCFALSGRPVVEAADVSGQLFANRVAIPLFTPAHRRFARDQAVGMGANKFDPLVDPTAILPSRLSLHEGVYINSAVVMGSASQLREFAFVNRGAVLGHDLDLGAFASIGPGVVIGGNVTVERGAVLCAGAVIVPGLTVGANAVVGAGAVVTQNVPPYTLVVGNPARVAKRDIPGYNGKGV